MLRKNIKIKTIMMDFELANYNAIKYVFGSS